MALLWTKDPPPHHLISHFRFAKTNTKDHKSRMRERPDTTDDLVRKMPQLLRYRTLDPDNFLKLSCWLKEWKHGAELTGVARNVFKMWVEKFGAAIWIGAGPRGDRAPENLVARYANFENEKANHWWRHKDKLFSASRQNWIQIFEWLTPKK